MCETAKRHGGVYGVEAGGVNWVGGKMKLISFHWEGHRKGGGGPRLIKKDKKTDKEKRKENYKRENREGVGELE